MTMRGTSHQPKQGGRGRTDGWWLCLGCTLFVMLLRSHQVHGETNVNGEDLHYQFRRAATGDNGEELHHQYKRETEIFFEERGWVWNHTDSDRVSISAMTTDYSGNVILCGNIFSSHRQSSFSQFQPRKLMVHKSPQKEAEEPINLWGPGGRNDERESIIPRRGSVFGRREAETNEDEDRPIMLPALSFEEAQPHYYLANSDVFVRKLSGRTGKLLWETIITGDHSPNSWNVIRCVDVKVDTNYDEDSIIVLGEFNGSTINHLHLTMYNELGNKGTNGFLSIYKRDKHIYSSEEHPFSSPLNPQHEEHQRRKEVEPRQQYRNIKVQVLAHPIANNQGDPPSLVPKAMTLHNHILAVAGEFKGGVKFMDGTSEQSLGQTESFLLELRKAGGPTSSWDNLEGRAAFDVLPPKYGQAFVQQSVGIVKPFAKIDPRAPIYISAGNLVEVSPTGQEVLSKDLYIGIWDFNNNGHRWRWVPFIPSVLEATPLQAFENEAMQYYRPRKDGKAEVTGIATDGEGRIFLTGFFHGRFLQGFETRAAVKTPKGAPEEEVDFFVIAVELALQQGKEVNILWAVRGRPEEEDAGPTEEELERMEREDGDQSRLRRPSKKQREKEKEERKKKEEEAAEREKQRMINFLATHVVYSALEDSLFISGFYSSHMSFFGEKPTQPTHSHHSVFVAEMHKANGKHKWHKLVHDVDILAGGKQNSIEEGIIHPSGLATSASKFLLEKQEDEDEMQEEETLKERNDVFIGIVKASHSIGSASKERSFHPAYFVGKMGFGHPQQQQHHNDEEGNEGGEGGEGWKRHRVIEEANPRWEPRNHSAFLLTMGGAVVVVVVGVMLWKRCGRSVANERLNRFSRMGQTVA